MSEPAYLAILRMALAQCEETLLLISDNHGRKIIMEHIQLLQTDIRRIEDFEQKQEMIRAQTATTFGDGAPCGGI